jgi:dihydroorotase-like cyclic amidohydrolase
MSESPVGVSRPSATTAPSPSNRVPILDVLGDLVLPDLVDGHMHPRQDPDGAAVDAARGGARPG